MYSGPLNRVPFQPDPALMQHQRKREEYSRLLWQREAEEETPKDAAPPDWETTEKKEGIAKLLEMLAPEDMALVALILFLLCDNTDNDVVLLGILLYVLLSK